MADRRIIAVSMLLGFAGISIAAASPPASRDLRTDGPVAALAEMVRAANAGDPSALMECFVFTDPATKTAAEVLLTQVAAEQRFYAVFAKAFPGAATPDNDALNALVDALPTATVSIDDQKATVKIASGQMYYFLRHNGQWRIDFDRTQAAMGTLPGPDKLDALRRQTAALNQLADDLRNNAIPNVATAINRLEVIEKMVPEPILTAPLASPAQASPP